MTQAKHYLGPLTDSSRWAGIGLRPGDVIVATPPKSGTTWMQTIVALLISGDPDIQPDPSTSMPWVDIRMRDLSELAGKLAAMTGRRSMKSHTPLDGLPFDDRVQYLCVFRHPLDAHFSFRAHARNIRIGVFDEWYPDPDTEGATFRHFLDGSADGFDCDAMPLAHILQHFRAARALADRPNVSLFHYADMTRDPAGQMARVAALLGISHSDAVMARLVRSAGFENMRANASRFAPGGGTGFLKSDAGFFHSGKSGKWIGQLTEAELRDYDGMMNDALSPDDRAWLEYGAQGKAVAGASGI